MKKLIILILVIFLTSGCYDNIELNNLAIISGVGIDYYDNEFHLTYEILNDIKTQDNAVMLSYTKEGAGKTINEAAINTNYKVGKKPYFAHLRLIIISESVAQNHLDDICDYLIRDTNIRDEFFVLVAKQTTPTDILKHNSDNNPVVSDLILNLLNNEEYNNNLAIKEPFQETLAKFISEDVDAVLSSVTLKEDQISLDNFYLFKGFKKVNTLDAKNSSLYNLLAKDVYALNFNKKFKEGNVAINIDHSNTNIDITNEVVTLNLKLDGKIVDNSANFNLKDEKSYETLNKEFSKIIEDDIYNFLKILQSNKTDILGLQDIYFKKYREKNKELWTTSDVKVNVDLKINTKGFIFEVENEK